MLTVLFVAFVLVALSSLLSALDNQCAGSEVSSYLHTEYRMETGVRPTLSTLRSL